MEGGDTGNEGGEEVTGVRREGYGRLKKRRKKKEIERQKEEG